MSRNLQRKPRLESAQASQIDTPVGMKYFVTLSGSVEVDRPQGQADKNEDFKIITHGCDAGA